MSYTYEEAFNNSFKYFNGDELAAKVFLDKYALRNNQGELLEDTPDKMHIRLAKEFARIESKKFKNSLSFEEIFNYFDRFSYLVPQGSPMYGIGNDFKIVSLSNCYLLDVPLDSYSSILKVDEQLVNISKRRGGVGINLSNLRPYGASTNNSARSSTGIGTWMERYSNSIREVGQNARRGALMLVLDVRHPDIETFITIKSDTTKVTGANVSVLINKEFMRAVENDENYQLQWPIDSKNPQIVKTIKAKYLWNLMIKFARDTAEPGILMWDNFLENGPADQYERYRSLGTNPCSEISLCPLDSCRLLAINLFSYVENPFNSNSYFNFDKLSQHSRIAQRLMDDLVDLESEKIDKILEKIYSDPEPFEVKRDEIEMWRRIKVMNDEGRRTGLGITALGDALAALNIKYGSEESIEVAEKIYQTIKLAAYRESVDIAKELGAFVGYDSKIEEGCPFIQRLKQDDEKLYNDMVKYGRRNVALTTTAPTGSLSILTQTTSGIEPVFMLSYKRRKKINPSDEHTRVDFIDQNGDRWQEFEVYHPKVKLWMEITGLDDVKKSPWFNATANDIDWINRVKLQAAAQKHVCHSISSTVNLPNNVSYEEVEKIYKTAFLYGCKGITIYRDGCRSGVLVSDTKKELENLINKTKAPKRPKKLPCDIHHLVKNKQRYYVVVGFLQNDVYEVFTGINADSDGEIFIPKNIQHGFVEKISKGQYRLIADKFEGILTNGHSDENADALTRMISLALRHGGDISHIVTTLEKTHGGLTSFAKVLARVLKKYIIDGTLVGENCAECQTPLIRENGCAICKSCGYSKCM